jgi:hypothetical protein
LSGGTITGDITEKVTDIDLSATYNGWSSSSGGSKYSGLRINDKNNRSYAKFLAQAHSNGNSGFWICANNGYSNDIGIGLVINKSGVASWTVSEPAKFRTAIGAGTGNGTVTSVALSMPSGFTVSGSPITGSGTLTVGMDSTHSIPLTSDVQKGVSAYNSLSDYLPVDGTAQMAEKIKYGYGAARNSNSKKYKLVAQYTVTLDSTGDRDVSGLFAVSNCRYYSTVGLLYVRANASSGSSTVNTSTTGLYWISRSPNLNTNRVILTTRVDSNKHLQVRLYLYTESTWEHARFTLLDEGTWDDKRNMWTMYGAKEDGTYCSSSIPNNETQFVSKDDTAYINGTKEVLTLSSSSEYNAIRYLFGNCKWSVGVNASNTFYWYCDELNNLAMEVSKAGALKYRSASSYSDIRMKNVGENVNVALEDVARAPLFKYTWKDVHDNRLYVGTSAQYWRDKLSEVVSVGSDGMYSFDYATTALACAISTARTVLSHDEEIAKLKARIGELENEIELLKAA